MQVATLFRETATLLSMESTNCGTASQMPANNAIMYGQQPPVDMMKDPCNNNNASTSLNMRDNYYRDHEPYKTASINEQEMYHNDAIIADSNAHSSQNNHVSHNGEHNVEHTGHMNHNGHTSQSSHQGNHAPTNERVTPTMSHQGQIDDPYSFVDDEPVHATNSQSSPLPHIQQILPSMHQHHAMHQQTFNLHHANMMMMENIIPGPRKRGRKKKMPDGDGATVISQEIIAMAKKPSKERKKHDRFNGMSEAEVTKRMLPDHLTDNLDLVIIGINPGLFAAYKGHHYAGPGNHFWKCLYLSGLITEQMTAEEDYKLLKVGIGFTNMVQRPTKGSADLTRKEIKEGCQLLLEKLQHYRPKIAVFNGKLIYEVFSGKKDFHFGRQPDLVDGTNTYMWVMPSSSARCAQLPRAADKVPFYAALKKFRDYLNGLVASINDNEVVFTDPKLKNTCEADHFVDDLLDASMKTDENGLPFKKKRGRPKKVRVDGEVVAKPDKRVFSDGNNETNMKMIDDNMMMDGQMNYIDGLKKKRGRPKKVREDVKQMNQRMMGQRMINYDNLVAPGQMKYCPNMTTAVEHSSNLTNMNTLNNVNSINTSNNMYSNHMANNSPYMQSPRPQSQPFTHSDLSSEISAAISSEQLDSPNATTSPSLDVPDFEHLSSTDALAPIGQNSDTPETTECCFSPAPSSVSEHASGVRTPSIRINNHQQQQQQQQTAHSHTAPPSNHNHTTYGGPYNSYSPQADNLSLANTTHQVHSPRITPTPNTNHTTQHDEFKVQDMSTKSLSGLESLVHQIPSINEQSDMTSNVTNTEMSSVGGCDPTYSYANYPSSSAIISSTMSGSINSVSTSSPFNCYPPRSLSPLTSMTSNATYAPTYMNAASHPANYANLMALPNGSTTSGPPPPHIGFMEHQHCAVPQVPVALSPYHPYSQQYHHAGYHPSSSLHMPTPNYHYYNAGYVGGTHQPSPPATYLTNHMFDRINSDVGCYGTF